jgi:tRNA pseudouridine55 synthase
MSASRVEASRLPRRRVDGVLLLDKPVGLTSNAALQRAKRLFRAEKAGHTGTLDPLASGLLPLCFGEATKFAQSLLDARKGYIATVRFGIATSTGDSEGETIDERPVVFGRSDLEAALPRFIGTIRQVPPRHSALKHRGKSYYEYARAGLEIARKPREIEIDAIEIVDWALPMAMLRVACGKGTYIRVLAEDLGAAVGSCAHLAGLRRTASGAFTLEGSVTLAALEAIDDPLARDALLLPVECLVTSMPRLDVGADTARSLLQGRAVASPGTAPGRYRCYEATRFQGMVDVGEGVVRPLRMMQYNATE